VSWDHQWKSNRDSNHMTSQTRVSGGGPIGCRERVSQFPLELFRIVRVKGIRDKGPRLRPWDEEDYVHRIGRTGRACRSGRAFSLVGWTRDLQVAEHRTVHKDENCPAPSTFCRRSRGETWEPLFREKSGVALQRGDFEKESRVLDRLLEQGFRQLTLPAQ
jgi:hypothetical protein